MSHQYVVTEPFLPRDRPPLPTLRDPDLLVYFRQEVDGLVMGGYERDPAPWTASARSFDAVPGDFNGAAAGRGLAALRGAQRPTPSAACPSWPTWASDG